MQDKELHSVPTNTEIATTLLGIEPTCVLLFRHCSFVENCSFQKSDDRTVISWPRDNECVQAQLCFSLGTKPPPEKVAQGSNLITSATIFCHHSSGENVSNLS
jgi:hypothetical protein